MSKISPSLGVCYYPEHWPEDMWAEDARRMVACGLKYVRIAEFAWSRFELERGVFDFAWLDEAIEVLAAAGLGAEYDQINAVTLAAGRRAASAGAVLGGSLSHMIPRRDHHGEPEDAEFADSVAELAETLAAVEELTASLAARQNELNESNNSLDKAAQQEVLLQKLLAEAGDHQALIQIEQDDFRALFSQYPHAEISTPRAG